MSKMLSACFVLSVFCLPVFSQDTVSELVINEIHYDPDVKTQLVEFIELYNASDSTVSLAGWQIADAVDFTFSDSTSIAPGGYVIVAYDPYLVRNKWNHLSVDQVYGPFEGKLSNKGECVCLLNENGDEVDRVEYQLGFPWPTVGDALTSAGTGASIQLVNTTFDNDLGGAWRSSLPTPGLANSKVLETTELPMIRQVKHTPKSPLAGEAVVISAKITDSSGFISIYAEYQVVEPGQYAPLNDGEYYNGWEILNLHDDGLNGDEVAGDSIFSGLLENSIQQHRRLIRYRVNAISNRGRFLTVPYNDDPCPNFAYFVYNGVPAWEGAARPGMDTPEAYNEDVMNALPVYHLISRQEDVEGCTWNSNYGGDEYRWWGTLVYDGEVYDHIRYRARGGVWRYSMRKNMWKFDFNRGHAFQARDDYGKKYDTLWSKLNLSACIQQGDYGHRGEQGMFEAASFRMFNMMGAPAPKTNWLQLRIIDALNETGQTQYEGDLWGLYMAIEQMDGRFLDEHNLPDGNLYKMEGGSGTLNNQGATAVTNRSDLSAFSSGLRRADEQWWRENVDLETYYAYRCVIEGVHHGDIGYGKNYFYYLNPETELWSQLPWDTDLTWAESMYGNGQEPFINEGRILSHEGLEIEYKNRMRECLDLFYNPDQMGQLIDELAAVIHDPYGSLSAVDYDRAMWDYNPVMRSGGKAGQGRFYEAASTRDFSGMVQLMKEYVDHCRNNRRSWMGTSGSSMISIANDTAIPDTPQVQFVGQSDYASNDLFFDVTPFSDPQGAASFAAMQWRLAEVEPFSDPNRTGAVEPSGPGGGESYTLIESETNWKYYKGTDAPSGSETEWREPGYDDTQWQEAQTTIGYGEGFVQTVLDDMRYNYSTVYLRKAFEFESDKPVGELTLEARFDDAIAVWLNGSLVVLDNVAEDNLAYNAIANGNKEVTSLTAIDLSQSKHLLVQGTNVLAVQVVNMSLTQSSDCFFDARLTWSEGSETDDTDDPTGQQTAGIVMGRRGHYEIDAKWMTPEMTVFADRIQVPSSEVKPGDTYRVRCRMKDNTGRWSHWSAPKQFTVTDSVATEMHSQLRITEIMFNARDPQIGSMYDSDDFEFIEITHVGSGVLNLSGVSITDGIEFDFADAAITSLSPGESVLIVKNVDAFVERYGSDLQALIAGEYKGQLSNGGEKITVEDVWQGEILDFKYDDKWHLGTDGDGLSLELIHDDIDSLGQATSWQASSALDGSPGLY